MFACSTCLQDLSVDSCELVLEKDTGIFSINTVEKSQISKTCCFENYTVKSANAGSETASLAYNLTKNKRVLCSFLECGFKKNTLFRAIQGIF